MPFLLGQFQVDSINCVRSQSTSVSEGFGTNSLIMAPSHELVSAERGATVMIEEPEIHLHPRAQAELAEVLTEVALEEDKQVIMTTHSRAHHRAPADPGSRGESDAGRRGHLCL